MELIEDRVLLLLSIKEKGKKISIDHIAEKVIRDEKNCINESQIKDAIDRLISKGLISESNKNYYATERGIQEIKERVKSIGNKLNLSYRMILTAKEYYPQIADAIIPFLKERATSVVKIFSDEKDPVNKIKPLFVRYAKYKPKPVNIQINNTKDLIKYVESHAIDFIPYIHRINTKDPDWFVLDLDAGPSFDKHERGFYLVKLTAKKLVETLEEYEISSCIKFSGSRGIQVWSSLENSKLPSGDIFSLYRKFAQQIQTKLEEKLQELPSKTLKEFYEIVKTGKPITTSTVAKKAERSDQILIDWSTMKPSGDVRAPFSLHYKTTLVSCPIDPKRLLQFELSEARTENVVDNLERLIDIFKLEKSDPSQIIKEVS